MSRSCCLVLLVGLLSAAVFADDQALWKEYGLIHTQTSKHGKTTVTSYEMKDLTGALAAWEWLRSPKGRSCDLAPFCTEEQGRTVIADDNYVVTFEGPHPRKAEVDTILSQLPNKQSTALPAILSFLPHQGLAPNSARYILGPVSFRAFAPELASINPGFDQGAEAQIAEYNIAGSNHPVHLAFFYYPTPEMARLHLPAFKNLPNTYVKRSDVLLAVVYGGATEEQADTILSQVQYQAKITWNDTPPPPPIKPLYQLLMNIAYLSIILVALCALAGLMYAAMRIYRRRYGQLESQEAMTTLNLGNN